MTMVGCKRSPPYDALAAVPPPTSPGLSAPGGGEGKTAERERAGAVCSRHLRQPAARRSQAGQAAQP